MLVPTLKLNQYVYMLLALHNGICLHPLTYKCKISLKTFYYAYAPPALGSVCD